jgi:tetratricopeptide (TPR) repeat protein
MTDTSRNTPRHWTQQQAVLLSLACLAAGIGGGLFIHFPQKNSGEVAAKTVDAIPAPNTPAPSTNASDPAQLKTMADSQAAPLIEQLKVQPNDAETLTAVANLYYDAKQYPIAVDYYGRALKVRPADASVRTDMGTAYWYLGDAERAIEQFNLALSYAPDNPNTLFNRGLVKWQGKKDSTGALADWQRLLTVDPGYEAKAQVEQMIAEVNKAGARQ